MPWQPRFEVVLGRTVSVTPSMSAVFKRLHVGRAEGDSADQSSRENDANDAGERSVMDAHPGPTKARLAALEWGEVKGCQGRSQPGELNKCLMNFKQLAVCLPAVLKDQRFKGEKTENWLIGGICIYLHSFCTMLISPSLKYILSCCALVSE